MSRLSNSPKRMRWEQRITSLYVAAAEQLGSDKAAVRLAGLYALARLGQDNPKLRQTVVDVLCAYLRMPYTPPVEVLYRNMAKSSHNVASDAEVPEPTEQPARREELQVRLTAQRLLADHLRVAKGNGPEPATYWRGPAGERMHLDLVGAVLVDFDLSGCASEVSVLHEAQFHGYANLHKAQFHGYANLHKAQFHGYANLHKAQFHESAYLDMVQFYGSADLRGAQFYGRAVLFMAQFHLGADLRGAQFHESASLGGAQFRVHTNMGGARFHGYVDLGKAQFHGDLRLTGAKFHAHANLHEAQFDSGVDMSDARAVPNVRLPPGWVFGDDTGTPDGLRLVIRGNDGVTRIDEQDRSAGSSADPEPGDTGH
ncbi:pentapeptide repeat-containing protein [Plantactinospora sp. GCM10030261]|uniref:pentapeptide repeat-containing protein n=1 Tax=Plantactinospora sp. GCM10030261 TaxID=3273420 RepID=UPI0036178B95